MTSATSYRRLIDIEATSCVCWESIPKDHLQITQLCSTKKDSKQNKYNVKPLFVKIGYPKNVIDSDTREAIFSRKRNFGNNKVKEIPFMVTYNPPLMSLRWIIK